MKKIPIPTKNAYPVTSAVTSPVTSPVTDAAATDANQTAEDTTQDTTTDGYPHWTILVEGQGTEGGVLDLKVPTGRNDIPLRFVAPPRGYRFSPRGKESDFGGFTKALLGNLEKPNGV